MNPKVEQWLKEQEEKKQKQETNRKNKLLIQLGLCEQSNDPIEGGHYDDDYSKYVKAFDVTNEEYEAILKYIDTYKSISNNKYADTNTNNGEGGLRTVARVVLTLCIIVAIIQIIWGLSLINSFLGGTTGIMMLLGAFVTIISGFVIYWTIKVFTNISEKTTEIRDILKSQSKK